MSKIEKKLLFQELVAANILLVDWKWLKMEKTGLSISLIRIQNTSCLILKPKNYK